MNTDIKNKLLQFDLHDLPLKSMCVDFKGDNIYFIFEFYNEGTKLYDEKKFIFKTIESLQIPPKVVLNYNGLELFDVSIENFGEKFKLEMAFLQGLSEPNWNISFIFKELEIVPL